MERNKNKIQLFGDKRHRETHLRRSVLALDDTDFLMEVRSARRRSIEAMAVDDSGISVASPANWKRAWNDFSISPDNIRNIFPLTKSQTDPRKVVEDLLEDPIPDLDSDPNASQVDESSSSKGTTQSESSSPLPKPSSSSVASTSPSEAIESPHPAWYNRLAALARREHQQEKDYHDTLDEHHTAKKVNAFRRNQNNVFFRNWQQRKSSRDGLDFSRDVALAMRHNSIYAAADSVTFLPPDDSFMVDTNAVDEDENKNIHNGYIQDTRPAANPKTTKSVLDLIA